VRTSRRKKMRIGDSSLNARDRLTGDLDDTTVRQAVQGTGDAMSTEGGKEGDVAVSPRPAMTTSRTPTTPTGREPPGRHSPVNCSKVGRTSEPP